MIDYGRSHTHLNVEHTRIETLVYIEKCMEMLLLFVTLEFFNFPSTVIQKRVLLLRSLQGSF